MSEALKPARLRSLQNLLSAYVQISANEAVTSKVPEILADIQAILQVEPSSVAFLRESSPAKPDNPNHCLLQGKSARSPPQPSSPLSEAELLHQHKRDQKEHASRSVGRRIAAGTHYCLDGSPDKETWLEDFKMLFEGHWNPDELPFPAKHGRQFLAGELCMSLYETCTKLMHNALILSCDSHADITHFIQVYSVAC